MLDFTHFKNYFSGALKDSVLALTRSRFADMTLTSPEVALRLGFLV